MNVVRHEIVKIFRTEKDCLIQYLVCQFVHSVAQKSSAVMVTMILQLYSHIRASKVLHDLEDANKAITLALASSSSMSSQVLESSQIAKVNLRQIAEAYEKLAGIGEQQIILFIDCMEQCDDQTGSDSIIERLVELCQNTKVSVRALVSSRQAPQVTALKKDEVPAIEITKELNSEDIKTTVSEKLGKLSGWTPDERVEACTRIVQAAQGLYRYVPQAIAFLEQPFQRPLKNRLEELPAGLTGLYQQEFQRTDPAYLKLLRVALTWTILARKDMTVDEVMDAFSGTFTTNDADLKIEDIPTNIDDSQLKKAGGSFLRFKFDRRTDGSEANTEFLKTFKSDYNPEINPQAQQNQLETVTQFVLIRDRSVSEYFLGHEVVQKGSDKTILCSKCKEELHESRRWQIFPFDGHLSIAKTCRKFLLC
jgi:hypothetical protein